MTTSSAMLMWPAIPHCAADHAALADGGAAGDPGAAGDDRVRADAHVVADLHEVVELDALLDHGVLDGAAIDGGVGADLHIRAHAHGAHLGHLDPRAALGREAEAIPADHHARLQHGCAHRPARCRARASRAPPAARPRLEYHPGVEDTVGTDEGARPDDHVLADDGERCHLCGRIEVRALWPPARSRCTPGASGARG